MANPKIFITAYNCSPGKGSEHSCGWNLIYNVSKYIPVTVITDEQFRNDFDPKNPLLKNITMVFIKTRFHIALLNSIEFPIGFYLTYQFWEKQVYQYLLEQHKLGQVDLINRVTIGSVKEPGYSWKVDVPYIWNEAHIPSHIPYNFFSLFSFKTKLIFLLINLNRLKILYFQGRSKAAFRKSFHVFASNLETKQLFKKHFNKDCGICYETGAIKRPLIKINERQSAEPLRILWAGRIVDFKGLELVLRAIHKLPSSVNYELTIAGEGNQKMEMMNLAKSLEINASFVGMVPYHEMPALFMSSHCYILTSFKDGMTNTILESLSNYCPVICLDHLTYGEAIDERVGLKVPVISIRQIISDLAQKIQYLFEHEDVRVQLIKNMNAVVHTLTWDQNARKVIRVYEKALDMKILTD